jgi:hypothetical protein
MTKGRRVSFVFVLISTVRFISFTIFYSIRLMMPGPVPSTFQVSVATTQPVRKVRWLQSSHDYGQSTTYLLAGMHGNQQASCL